MMNSDAIPIYQRIKQALLEQIIARDYEPGQRFITQQEVCERFAVSRITAERALNELVREGVLTRHRGKGTFVASSPPATQETASRLPTIACIVDAVNCEHVMSIIRGMEHICRESGYHLLLFDSNKSLEIEAENLQRALSAGAAGIIVYPLESFVNAPHYEALYRSGIPLVMIDRYYPAIPTDVVVPDHVDAGYSLTSELIKQGHRHIATVWMEIECTSVYERLVGYKQALHEHDLTIESDYAVLRPYTLLPVEERHALLSRWLAAPNRPTVILAANNQTLGIAAMDLLSLGLRLGEDIMLAAMDSDQTGVPISFASSNVVLPSYEMGCEATRLLLDRLRARQRPSKHVVLPVSLSTSSYVIMNHRSASQAGD